MKVLIDTDTAGDDTFSILLALSRPDVEVVAITVCNGNVPFAQQVENALVTVERASPRYHVPVYVGHDRPMVRDIMYARGFFGADGMSNAHFAPARQRPESKHAVDAIIDLVMSNPGEISILAQAPLTNIAMAYLREPRIARAVRHLWVMGGTDYGLGNITPSAEFNFFVDPEAAKIVLNAGFPLTLSTWNLTMTCGILPEDVFARIAGMGTPLSEFFLQVSQTPLETTRGRYGKALSTHPDSLTCACMIDESLILESADCIVDIETEGTLTRGYSVVSPPITPERARDPLNLWPDCAPNVRMIRKADTNRFADMLMAALA